MKKEPEDKSGKYCYGFASDGRVLLEEHHLEATPGNTELLKGVKYEAFWEHTEERIDSALFDYSPDKWAINVETTFIEARMARGFIRYSQRGLSVESYEYRDGVLVCVHKAEREHATFHMAQDVLIFVDEHLTYRDGNLVEIVRKWQTGGDETVRIKS